MPVPILLLILIAEYSEFQMRYHLLMSNILKMVKRFKKWNWSASCLRTRKCRWLQLGYNLVLSITFWLPYAKVETYGHHKAKGYFMMCKGSYNSKEIQVLNDIWCTYRKRWLYLYFDSFDHCWYNIFKQMSTHLKDRIKI